MGKSKRVTGFTLIELLVVMAILGLLMAISVPKVGNLVANAREHKCRNNLRNLQAGVMSYMQEHGGAIPFAMSYEVMDKNRTAATAQENELVYSQRPGWITWSPNTDPRENALGQLHQKWHGNSGFKPHENECYHDLGVGEIAKFGVEYGSLFDYMNRSFEHYVCPVIRSALQKEDPKKIIYRTYAMSAFFGGPTCRIKNQRVATKIGSAEAFDRHVPEASKLLLFAEVFPDMKGSPYSRNFNSSTKHSTRGDCIIDPASSSDTIDTLPFGNPKTSDAMHRAPKGAFEDASKAEGYVGLVVFFDGHITKITSNRNNPIWAYNRGLDPSLH